MFERLIYSVLDETITALATPDDIGRYPKLARALSAPGRSPDEVASLVAFFVGDGRPKLRQGFGGKTPMPCIAITLGGEGTQGAYLGNQAGATPEAVAFVDAVERELGHPVEAHIKRFSLSYNLWIYAENPDVTLAYYTIVRDCFLVNEKRLAKEGLETPDFSGMDLAPDPRYIPENVHVRQFTIQGFGHALYALDLDLGGFATSRVTKVDGLYVANNVRGVTPRVTPVPLDEATDGAGKS